MRLAIHPFNRRSVEIDLRVDDEQRVVRVDDVIVDAHTIQVLLQQTLEEHVLFFKSGLLFLDGKFVEQDLVVPLVEIVEQLELVVLSLFHSLDFFDGNLGDVIESDLV